MTKISVDAQMLDDVLNKIDKQTAELAKLKPLARGERLRLAEASLNPKTRGGRLIEAEAEIAATAPKDPRALYSYMTVAKSKPAAPPKPRPAAKAKPIINRAALRSK